MPELRDDMYCSQQICIPPTFPYVLRQYAKAAIRSQPMDLLKWSTAYFRCLSLNIPPPVKPRLEYPIPHDYMGVTPGWLRALLDQMQDVPTVSFKVLWDRWTGACLQHATLIKILCLGAFTDNRAVPWLRFIALCAAFLCENLTKSMILICEILTEEPEGGCAMIPLATFLDLYKFLAAIDASCQQILKNIHFTDSALDLFRKEEEQAMLSKDESTATTLSSESTATVETIIEEKEEDVASVISCPSVTKDDYMPIADYFKKIAETLGEAGEDAAQPLTPIKSQPITDKGSEATLEEKAEQVEEPKTSETKVTGVADEGKKEEGADAGGADETVPLEKMPSKTFDDDDDESADSSDRKSDIVKEEKCDQANLERLRALRDELLGETDDELEKFKAQMIHDYPMTEYAGTTLDHYKRKIKGSDDELRDKDLESLDSKDETSAEDKSKYEDVFVDVIPGIGHVVPEEMLIVACAYLEEVGRKQHDMIMPRNINHFTCPPLHLMDF